MVKNNKGFVITEVLIISTVVIGILIFMYAQFKKLNRGYQYSFKYDTVQSLYLTNNLVNYINDGNYDLLINNLNASGLSYLDITGCNVLYFHTSKFCEMLIEKSNVEQALFTKENLIELKAAMFDLPEDMKQYINTIETTNAENDYRLIVKYKDDTYATMRFNRGETYIKDGLIVHLDALNNTKNGYSSEITTWSDLSGNNNDAILYNAPTWENNSLVFNGINQYGIIKNTENIEFNNGFTWEIRFKILNLNNLQNEKVNIFGNQELYGGSFYIDNTGKPNGNLYVNDNFYSFNHDNYLINDEFNTLTITYDNETAKLYLNGKLNGIKKFSSIEAMKVSNVPIALAGDPSTNQTMNSYANITVQNVLIYDRSLSDYEVQKNYEIDELRF